MDTMYREVTKEQYEKYKAMHPGVLNNTIERTLSDDILCGYGFYGAYTVALDGKYYVCIKTGSTCD